MRIALAQINPTVGNLAHNTRKILDFIRRAQEQSADLVVFPELTIPGYPPKDLLLKEQFINDNLRALNMIASRVRGIDVVVGYAEKNSQPIGRPLHNAVALVRDGQIVSRHFKTLLPTYDVFDETRYFEPGPVSETGNLVRIKDRIAGLTVCEDLWNDEKMIPRRLYHQNPIAKLHAAGAEVLLNCSASPFVEDKHPFRIDLFSSQVKQFNQPLIYVNQVGGNDELVFDGNSCAFDAEGKLIAQAKDFEEDLVFVDLPREEGSGFRVQGSGGEEQTNIEHRASNTEHRTASPLATLGWQLATPSQGIESIYKALALGLRDYVRKCGFKSVVIGLSGGIDSAVTAALAVAALGADKVTGVSMPSRFSSDHSISDAEILARNLGIAFHIVPIKEMHDAYENILSPVFSPSFHLPISPSSSPLGDDITEQNIQARIRGGLLMAFSNRYNHLLLTTGNKSELAVGYCTLYGDMCGGLAVISDVLKTTVYKLAEFINQQAGRDLIPRNTITKPPSAELRPNQTDQDSLPPYEVLDAILFRYIEEERGAAEIIAEGFDPAIVMRVVKLIDRSEYKRRQAAPGLKVSTRAFGFGRRMPIAQNYEQLIPKHGEPAPQEK